MRCLFSLLSVVLLALAIPAAADNIVYSNGPINGEINGWDISGEFSVSDSFTFGVATDVQSMHFGVWVQHGGIPNTVAFGISATPFGTDLASGTATLSNIFQFTNSDGADVYLSSFTFPGVELAAGTYYITLSTGLTTDGHALFWDENDGPSIAFASSQGTIGSESFSLDGTPASTPEPGTFVMLATSVVAILGIRRARL